MSFKMTNEDIRSFLYVVFTILLSFIIGLWSWKVYNTKKYGSYNRRKYPPATTEDELLALGLMSKEDYLLLQESKIATFEKNPIREI
jgi:poly-beta-1,6-N-acetyl-D-glucosamine synthesis protein